MKGAYKAFFLSLTCLVFSAAFFSFAYKTDAQNPSVAISPSTQVVSIYSSQTVAVDVLASGASGLYGYQYDIGYDPNVLTPAYNGVAQGTLLKNDGATIFCVTPDTSVSGRIRNIACTRQAAASGISGSGSLNRITFNIKQTITPPLTTQISLSNVKLSNINSQQITGYSLVNGSIDIKVCTGSENKACGSNVGECRSGTQTCSNNQWGACGGSYVGPTNEICDSKDNDCDGQTDESLSRSCSTTHYGRCTQGTETCSAGTWAGCPQPIQEICSNGIDEDCDGSDSTCKGDVNSDQCIDIQDMSIVAIDFGKTSGFTNPKSDIDGNGVVDIFDLIYVGKDFGAGC